MVRYHKYWCKPNRMLRSASDAASLLFLLSSIQAVFLQWPRELSLKELPAEGWRKWQLRKWVPEWWIAGYKTSRCISGLTINELHCIEQGHTWASRITDTPQKRLQTLFSLFWRVFPAFSKIYKLRLVTALCTAGSWTSPIVSRIWKNWKKKKKGGGEIHLFSLSVMKTQIMKTACASGNRRGHSPLGRRKAELIHIDFKKANRNYWGIWFHQFNKKVHQQHKKRRWI